jgi:hypothetical protein
MTPPPDDASDLWDRPPRPRRTCAGCSTRAEPYSGVFCWLCSVTGVAATVRRRGMPDALARADRAGEG